jgi:RNA polymerase sigma-70 factor (ECF subfamily)
MEAFTPRAERAAVVSDPRHERQFLALLDDHGPVVLALLRRLCRDRHDAEDAFQETAVRVWRSLSNQPALRNPRGWLLTIAYRAFLDQAARQRGPEGGHDCEHTPDVRRLPPEAEAERGEEQARVREAIAALPEPLRDVVLLHYTGQLTLEETARAMGLAAGTVKSRLHAALAKLRGLLR